MSQQRAKISKTRNVAKSHNGAYRISYRAIWPLRHLAIGSFSLG